MKELMHSRATLVAGSNTRQKHDRHDSSYELKELERESYLLAKELKSLVN